MKIVLAFDSFKGSLSAAAICRIAAAVTQEHWPDADVVAVPMADGGEGTIEALVAARAGHIVTVPDVSGPLPGQRVTAAYGWMPNEKTAVVEMARASGLPLIPEHQRNPLVTTTRGTGELIAEALALIPASRRWEVTFNTYFTSLPAGATCVWRCCLPDASGVRDVRRNPKSLLIDLTRDLPAPKENELVVCAREGTPLPEIPRKTRLGSAAAGRSFVPLPGRSKLRLRMKPQLPRKGP